MTLGEAIRHRREQLKLSQGYVAEQLGVSRQAVSKWETGQSEPTAGNLIQLAEVLETSLSDLADPQMPDRGQGERPKQLNPVLRANLTRIAIAAQAACLSGWITVFYQYLNSSLPDRGLYFGALVFWLVPLALCSLWMAANHRYEPDLKRRRKNALIELGYCCVQLAVALLTVRLGLGLVGTAILIGVGCIYILYINPRFMSRKLTK